MILLEGVPIVSDGPAYAGIFGILTAVSTFLVAIFKQMAPIMQEKIKLSNCEERCTDLAANLTKLEEGFKKKIQEINSQFRIEKESMLRELEEERLKSKNVLEEYAYIMGVLAVLDKKIKDETGGLSISELLKERNGL